MQGKGRGKYYVSFYKSVDPILVTDMLQVDHFCIIENSDKVN
jgi:hypothetical protein